MDSYTFYFTYKDTERLSRATIWSESYKQAEKYFRLIHGKTALIHDVDFGSWMFM